MDNLTTLRAAEAVAVEAVVGATRGHEIRAALDDYAAAIEARVNLTHAMLAANQERMRRDVVPY